MATLTKSRKRTPIAIDNRLAFSSSYSGTVGHRFDITMRDEEEETPNGRATFYTLQINKDEATRLASFIAACVTREGDGWKDNRSPVEALRALADMMEADAG